MNEQDEDRLDNFLRDKLGSYRPTPNPAVWESVERRLASPTPTPPPSSPRFNRVFSVMMAGLIGVLIGWFLNHSGTPARSTAQPTIAQQPLTIEPAAGTNPGQSANAAAISAADPNAPTLATAPAAGSLPTALSGASGNHIRTNAPSRYESQPVTYPASAATAPTAAAPVRAIPNPAVSTPSVASSSSATASSGSATSAGNTGATSGTTSAGSGHAGNAGSGAITGTTASGVLLTGSSSNYPTPIALGDLVAHETVVETTIGDSARTSRARLRTALLAEKAELVQLHHRADSLLRALEPVVAIELSNGVATSAAEPDVDAPVIRLSSLPKPRFTHRWAVALAFTPERTFLGLQAPSTDTLMRLRHNHESGRAGLNAAITGEYRVSDRFSVGMGVGYSRYGAELRLTDRKTEVHVRYDTTTTTSITTGVVSQTIVAIRTDSVAQLTPRFNASGQVAYYDTVYVYVQHADSITLITTDQVKNITKTVKPTLTQHDVVTYRALRPTYHFVTLPIMVRYRLTANNRRARCWADVAMGAQVQLFRGGSQLVTSDGRNYRTERVGANEGPFRPINVALTGQFALNYALSPRLSANLAPAVRWQMQSVYKRETGLRQQPISTGVQLGVRWTL